MTFVDVFIFILSAVAFTLGFKDGFIRKLIGTVGFIIAIFIGIRFSDIGGKVVSSISGIEPVFAQVAGGFLIFLLVIALTTIIKRVVHPFDKVNNLINRIVGGLAGVGQMLIFISALLFILNVFQLPAENTRKKSYLYNPVRSILPGLVNVLKTVTPSTQDTLKEIIQ